MSRDRNFLIGMYNASSTADENDNLETYEAWLEKQLLRRLEKIDELEERISLLTKEPASKCCGRCIEGVDECVLNKEPEEEEEKCSLLEHNAGLMHSGECLICGKKAGED